MRPLRLVRWRRPGTGPVRVAIVAESYLPAVNGVTNSVVRVSEELRRRGHEVLVIAPASKHVVGPDEGVVRVRAVDVPRAGDLRIGLPTARLAAVLRRFDPDVVHLAAPTVLGAAGARAARRLGLPVVAVFQTDLAGFARRHGAGLAQSSIWRWTAGVHRLADLTLAPSSASAWALRSHGVHDVRLWGRGVDLQRFDPARRDPVVRSGLAPEGEVLVGYVGRLAREKQVHRLRGVAALPGVQVVIVGDGPERRALERTLPTARFLGLRTGDELGALYASLDVFVHTGLDETFCQTVQEALASALAVVAPAVGGPLDLVRHRDNGLLWSPDMPGSLEGAVDELVASPVLRHRLGAQARASVLHRPWTAVVDELLEHYASVTGRALGAERAA